MTDYSMRGMSVGAVPGNSYVRLNGSSTLSAHYQGRVAAEHGEGAVNPYEVGTPEHEAWQFSYGKAKEYEAAKAANGGNIPEGW